MPGRTSSPLRLGPSGVAAIAEHEIIEFEGTDEYSEQTDTRHADGESRIILIAIELNVHGDDSWGAATTGINERLFMGALVGHLRAQGYPRCPKASHPM